MSGGKQEGVECLQVVADLRRIYDLIDALVHSLQLVRRHKPEAEEFINYLEENYLTLHEKAAVLYPDAHNQLSRLMHKYMHELEEHLRSAQELMNELAEPFRIFTRAAEKFKTLHEEIEKTLGLMEIILQFAPPEKLDAYGEPRINIGTYDPLPEKWYDPPPAAEILLETKSSSSSGVEAGKLALTRTFTGRVLDEVRRTPVLFSDLFGYVDNRQQLTLMIESFKTLVPAEDSVHQRTSPYLQTMLSDPHSLAMP